MCGCSESYGGKLAARGSVLCLSPSLRERHNPPVVVHPSAADSGPLQPLIQANRPAKRAPGPLYDGPRGEFTEPYVTATLGIAVTQRRRPPLGPFSSNSPQTGIEVATV